MLKIRVEQGPDWNFPCPHDECGYYIEVAVDSGTGEAAANLMDSHVQRAHGERFPAWRT